MPPPNTNAAAKNRRAQGPKERSTDPATDPLPDAFTQIRQARDEIIAAVIRRAIDDGCYQRAKWLFEFAAVHSAAAAEEDEEPGLLRLIWNQLQIPESPEEIAAELSANDHAVE